MANNTITVNISIEGATPEGLARRFYEVNRELAPQYGFSYLAEILPPWEDRPQEHRDFSIAVAAEIIKSYGVVKGKTLDQKEEDSSNG